MTDMRHIMAVETVVHGVLKIVWDDGYEGIVDLRGVMKEGSLYGPIRDMDRFRSVRLAPHGHSIYWGDPDDEDLDFGCDRLRTMAEEQADLLMQATG